MVDRRQFLLVTSAGFVAWLRGQVTAQARDPLSGLIVINSLGSLEDGYAPRRTAIGDAEVIAANRASGLTAITVTVASSDHFDATVARIREYDAFVAAHAADVLKVLTASDVRRAKAEQKIGLIYGFQNAAMMGDRAERVDTFADMGVRIIQLTYNGPNQLGGGSLAPGDPGLTAFGRTVIERLNTRRIAVDLSHSGHQLCLDAARASSRPICITHTGCKAIADSPRNKTDEELRLVADKGGYVGIYFMPYLNPGHEFSSEDVARHLDHAVKICGEDHVGIGSDHGVTELGDVAAVREFYGKQVAERRKQGISVAGEDVSILPHGNDLIGPNQFRVIAERLAKRRYPAKRIEKIMGLNFLRYCGDVWGA